MKNDFDDVSLSDGLAYMVPRKDFEAYLAQAESAQPLKLTAREKKQVCRSWDSFERLFKE